MAAKPEDLARHRESRRESKKPSAVASGRSSRRCPICGAEASSRYRPFCSARCADVDLARWLNETYSVPGEPASDSTKTEKSEAD